ncbi:DUF2759 domain-containing protein [Bacillus luteolus]|uniref:DUF2759 domain-containing protein n=1 Tax=Litchfieldia luteola TaxID=682179 RepID=A0ABR9QHI9_9BACI|nr:DUF2759 domain-containing protein [Cytobacillus luteolus]MBE4907961.1 DUF2759 domain-containing protein [Cytobacillus luteolus]MBP1942741.1 putative membrane protein [Cytobacillus luteolus]
MGLVIIFALVTIFSVFGALHSIRTKNLLGIMFSLGTVAVFGWFTIMTVLNHGFPVAH